MAEQSIERKILNQIKQTKELLAKEDKQAIEQDYQFMPAWVSSIIKSIYASR